MGELYFLLKSRKINHTQENYQHENYLHETVIGMLSTDPSASEIELTIYLVEENNERIMIDMCKVKGVS